MQVFRTQAFTVSFLLLLVLGIWYWLSPIGGGPANKVSTPATPSTSGPGAGGTAESSAPDLSIYKTDPKWIWWNEQQARDPRFEWKMPINFYGKVVDQDDTPIGGVEIAFQWTDLSARGTSERTVVSGGDGSFSLTEVKGKRLIIIKMFKPGYYRSVQGVQRSFEYAAFFEPTYHQPDPNRPVVFQMRKSGGIPQELIVRESLIRLPADSPRVLDLIPEGTGASGQVAIALNYFRPKGSKRYDWSAVIEGVDGSVLIESEEEFMFEAPEDNYLPKYTYQISADDPSWTNKIERNYYVRTNSGYSRLEVEILANSRYAHIRFFINPSGSRNLEYPPFKPLPYGIRE